MIALEHAGKLAGRIKAGVKRWQQSGALTRLLALRRSWQEVVDSPDPDVVTRLCEDVSHVGLPTSSWLMRLAGVPREVEDQIDLSARQYLLAATLYTDLQPSVLLAVRGRQTAVAAPREWRRHLETQGLRFRPVLSDLLYRRVVLLHGMRGIITAVRALTASLRGQLPNAPQRPYEVLMTLPPSLLSRGGNGPRDSLVGWFADRSGGPLWVEASGSASDLPENCTVTPGALPRLGGVQYLRFILGSLRALGAGIVGLLADQPQMLLLLRDMVLLAHARAVGPETLARSYTAENSQWIHRPLYTVWAERSAGSRAQLLFYATNMDEVIRYGAHQSAPAFLPGYRIMSWSDYLVWDSHHADLVIAWGHGTSRITVVGTVPLSESGSPIPPLPPRSIAIFDVAPFKPARLAKLGVIPAYYNARVAIDFLRQCHEAARQVGGTLVLKQKRDIGKNAHSDYRQEVERLKTARDVLIVDPGISAGRLAAVCDAIVSMPFSSPSLFGREAGVPAALFDPTAVIVASERQAHGLPLLRGKAALQQWLAEALAAADPAQTSGPESA